MPIYTIPGYKWCCNFIRRNTIGVTVDNTLSRHIQGENVLNNCNTYLFLLSRINQFLFIDSRQLFYNAYILPHLDYCCVIWGNCSRSLEENISDFRKSKHINPKQRIWYPFPFLFSQLKWMTFPAIQMYKTLSGTSPNYLKIPFTFTSDIHSRTLRSSHETQMYIPKPRIELFSNTFVFSGSSIWNSIPDCIRNSSNLFKVRYLKW